MARLLRVQEHPELPNCWSDTLILTRVHLIRACFFWGELSQIQCPEYSCWQNHFQVSWGHRIWKPAWDSSAACLLVVNKAGFNDSGHRHFPPQGPTPPLDNVPSPGLFCRYFSSLKSMLSLPYMATGFRVVTARRILVGCTHSCLRKLHPSST